MSDIESVLNETRLFPPADAFARSAAIPDMAAYRALCAEAERDYEGFWARLAREQIGWKKPFTKTLDESNAPFFKWFEDGMLNASWNCLDRHLPTIADKTAIVFEADDGQVALRLGALDAVVDLGRRAVAHGDAHLGVLRNVEREVLAHHGEAI